MSVSLGAKIHLRPQNMDHHGDSGGGMGSYFVVVVGAEMYRSICVAVWKGGGGNLGIIMTDQHNLQLHISCKLGYSVFFV